MHDKLTENDIKRLQEEIDYRKLVVRKDAIQAVKRPGSRGISAKILNITRQKGRKIK